MSVRSHWRSLVAGLLTLVAASGAPAQSLLPPESGKSARSSSGQFLVCGVPGSVFPTGGPRLAQRVQLTPALTAISCERLKTALLGRLGLADRWQGRIHIVFEPFNDRPRRFDFSAQLFADGWQYRLQGPDAVEPAHFARAVLGALLVELANRSGPARTAELPVWLVEGFAAEIADRTELDLVVAAPETRGNSLPLTMTVRNRHRFNPLGATRDLLINEGPLTIEQLSWPDAAAGTGADTARFRASAHLLVHELLELPDGPLLMRRFIERLPANFNWQAALLAAYRPHFDSLRAFEKWWLVQTAHFTSHENSLSWPPAESWHRLAEALPAAVRVQADKAALPVRDSLALQSIVREWTVTQQRDLLGGKLRDLAALGSRLAPEVATVAESYRGLLTQYLAELNQAITRQGRNASISRELCAIMVRRLDTLDARRLELQRSQTIPATTSVKAAEPPPRP